MKQLRKVRPEDFDAEMLMAAAREGRLYLDMTHDEATLEQLLARCQREALDYVSAIEDYVAPDWQPNIKELWTALLRDAFFAPQLVLQKGRSQGQLNKYLVTNIVDCMRGIKVYQCETLLELHKKMEGVGKKNSIYKSAGMYCLNWEQKQRFHELVKSIQESKINGF